MALIIQVVVLDDRDYILDYKDFRAVDRAEINNYIWTQMAINNHVKIQIRKWKHESK